MVTVSGWLVDWLVALLLRLQQLLFDVQKQHVTNLLSVDEEKLV